MAKRKINTNSSRSNFILSDFEALNLEKISTCSCVAGSKGLKTAKFRVVDTDEHGCCADCGYEVVWHSKYNCVDYEAPKCSKYIDILNIHLEYTPKSLRS